MHGNRELMTVIGSSMGISFMIARAVSLSVARLSRARSTSRSKKAPRRPELAKILHVLRVSQAYRYTHFEVKYSNAKGADEVISVTRVRV